MPYTYLTIFTFIGALIITWLCRAVGIKLKITDNPDNYRKVHESPIPLMGGFAIFFSTCLAVLAASQISPNLVEFSGEANIFVFFIGALLILATGVYDDIKDMRPRYKALMQMLVATLLYFFGFAINKVSIPYIGTVDFAIISYPMTLFWFMGCMNVINLLDGLDGLAGGVSLFAIITLAISLGKTPQPLIMSLCLIVIASLLAFLIFNFNPASIFLGDAGAMLLGFFIASLSLITNHKAETALTLAIPFIAIGLPVFDTVVAFLRRWSRRVPISTADRKHIHHVLLSSGLSTKAVVLILYAICLVFSSVSYLLILKRDGTAMIFLSIILVIAFLYAKRFGIINTDQILKRIKDDHLQNKRASRAHVELEKCLHQFENAKTTHELWYFASPLFETMKLHKVHFRRLDSKKDLTWESTSTLKLIESSQILDEWSLTTKVFSQEQKFGVLEIYFTSQDSISRDLTLQLNSLRKSFAEHLGRLKNTTSTSSSSSTSKQELD